MRFPWPESVPVRVIEDTHLLSGQRWLSAQQRQEAALCFVDSGGKRTFHVSAKGLPPKTAVVLNATPMPKIVLNPPRLSTGV
jgi:hypothetical protein